MFLSSKRKKEIEDLFRRAPAPDLVDGRRCPKPLSNSTSSPNHVKSITASPSSRRRISVTSTVDSPAAKALSRVDVLSEELPFIQRFKGKTVVVKYGGAAMKSPELQASVIRDLVLLSCVDLRPILVHGGGAEINSWLLRVGVDPQFRNGLRVTDALTMEVVEMVLVGKVNKNLLSLINVAGGLCGKDTRASSRRAPPPTSQPSASLAKSRAWMPPPPHHRLWSHPDHRHRCRR
ncbi:hypothetical protein QYE76_037789 [Lolium multiflorum]|uniref:Aspartate/glutamate/uridylate kinase domain-containing protein n=1 Tax=Lolium multiflorum TaxID=4521 RepID=A0AAD8QGU6_LOLMU|nr:hypothetical protein QYE76_037789 [Lolium multiflorum]